MIYIVFKNKELLVKQDSIIFQHENLMDKIKILIPQEYNGYQLKDFDIYLQYENITNNVKKIKLILSDETYKDMLVYILPVDNELTYSASKLKICLKFRKIEYKEDKTFEYRMHSNYSFLDIVKSSDYDDYKIETDGNGTDCDFDSHYIVEF